MNAIIKQIQEALEHGRPLNVDMGTLGAQVMKEIQKPVGIINKNNSQKKAS